MASPRLLREAPHEDRRGDSSHGFNCKPVSIGERLTTRDRPADVEETNTGRTGDAIDRPCVEMGCGVVRAGEVFGKCESRHHREDGASGAIHVGSDKLKEIALARLERESAIEMKRACDKRVEELQAAVDALSVIRAKLRSELCQRMDESDDKQRHIVHKINLDELD